MNPVHLKSEVIINAPMQVVWDGLIAFTNSPYWSEHVEHVTSEPFGKGTVIRVEKRRKVTLLTVEESEPPVYLKLIVIHGKSRGEANFSLTQDGKGTLLEHDLTLYLNGLAPVLMPVIGHNIKRELQRLRRSVEHDGTGTKKH